jgi:ATP-binding cassette, subfamily B, bacterial
VNKPPDPPQELSLGYDTLLRSYLLPRWRQVLALALLLAASIALQLVGPQVLRAFIDAVSGGPAVDQLAWLAGLFLAVAVVGQIVKVAETHVAVNLGQVSTNELRADLTRHCLDLDLGFHNARTPGELIERIDGDVASLANFFSSFVTEVLGNALLLVAVLALLFGVTTAIGLAVSALAFVALAALYRLRRVAVPRWTAARQASAELFGFLEERLGGTEDIRSSGAVGHTLRRLAERSLSLFRAERSRMLFVTLTYFAADLILTLVTVVGLALAATAFLRGEISIGAVYLVFAYTQLLGRPIEQLTRQLQDLQRALAGLARIRELFAIRGRLDTSGRASLPAGALAVDLVDVAFGYDSDDSGSVGDSDDSADLVLRGLSLAVRPGEIVGLLGRTGSGKTTLSRLVARFYDPRRGVVRVGGVDLREASLESVRRAIGVVTQEVHLFHASVRDNLTLFDPDVPDERIAAVLRDLGLWNWCQALPGGLDARLAPGGSGLSAGEAQLLAFARVFLRSPGLVILDEASSHLDPATERRIECALDRLLVGRTAIVIAHRLATVERADTIVILESGVVRECGPRLALAGDPASEFARLRQVGLEGALG